MVQAYKRKQKTTLSPESLDWFYGGYAFGTTWYNKDFGDGYAASYSATYVSGAPEKTTYDWSFGRGGRVIDQGRSRTAEGARNAAERAHQRALALEVIG